MKSLFLVATVVLLFSCVSAQDELLCELNFLTDSSSANKTFVCSTSNATLSLENVTLPANSGNDVFEVPSNDSLIVTWSKDGVSGNYTGNFTEFWLQIDAGTAVGQGAVAEVSYDFEGDGTWDRNETFDLFPTDPVEGFQTWHGDASNLSTPASGNYTNLKGGNIRLRVWSAFGGSELFLKVGASTNETLASNISFPFSFFASNATGGTGGTGGGVGGGGANATCCTDIADIRTELTDLANRVDILNARLANVTQSCCNATAGTATATATATATQVKVSTAVGTATGTGTVAGTA
jgi:hypothetical protein